MPLVAVAGSVVSWLVLARWWSAVPLADHALGALAAVGGFGVLTVAGSAALLARRATIARGAEARGIPDQAIWVGLVGHAFLLFAASRPELALPPWPLLAVLLLLDLALAVAALKAKRGPLLLGALAASQAVLGVWLSTASGSPWPQVALGSAIGIAALGLGALALAPRFAPTEEVRERFAVSGCGGAPRSASGVDLRDAVAGHPRFAWLISGTLALLLAELRLGARRDWEGFALPRRRARSRRGGGLADGRSAVSSQAPPLHPGGRASSSRASSGCRSSERAYKSI